MGVSKNRGKPPKMDGENNGKPYSNGWFGGTIIFGNTHMAETVSSPASGIKDHWILFTTFCFSKISMVSGFWHVASNCHHGILFGLKNPPWIPSKVRRLWCVFELAAFLQSHRAEGFRAGSLLFKPIILAPATFANIMMFCLLTGHPGWNWSHVGAHWIVGTCDLDVGRCGPEKVIGREKYMGFV